MFRFVNLLLSDLCMAISFFGVEFCWKVTKIRQRKGKRRLDEGEERKMVNFSVPSILYIKKQNAVTFYFYLIGVIVY